MQHQAVLRQKPREQQTMELLIGALGHQQFLDATELPPLRSQPHPQFSLGRTKMLGTTVPKDLQSHQCGPTGSL